ncbi:MAG: nuclear transport factor 2 family protein [Nitrospinota bacterium]|nr:nuclear transport factor 2 family protein [Nitrospinota bacterium]
MPAFYTSLAEMINEQKILDSNGLFYEAFNSQDLELMKKVWLDDPVVICIHPGWHVLKEYGPVMQSWEGIFQANFNQDIKVSDVNVACSQGQAWVSCQENLYSITSSGVQVSKIHATNLFQQMDGEWKMILHHASSMPTFSEEKE